ncbi:MAG: nucleoside triphosphate pyrophosphohydrolase [Malacoplasma sp.]
MEKIYNKLVRDKIPQIIENDNKKPITRILGDEEYKSELEKKLLEEYKEVLSTKTSDERIEELADMYEIICCLAELENKNICDVCDVAKNKKLKRGGFEKKIFLEKVLDNE